VRRNCFALFEWQFWLLQAKCNICQFNVAGTETGQGSGAEINGSLTAKKKSNQTKHTKSKSDKKETTPDTTNNTK
jgi:hypothetical protein